jgi:hypothetical protein
MGGLPGDTWSDEWAMDEPRDEKEHVLKKHLRSLGPEVVGGIAGSTFAGPIGAAVGTTLAYSVKEVLGRLLAHRQVSRIDRVLDAAKEHIAERRQSGDEFRQDGFFPKRPGTRSDADEVMEGVLFTAMTDYEERKTPFYGYLFANLAFDTQIDGALAHSLIRLAERLTYRQLCLLALVEKKSQFALPADRPRGSLAWRAWSVHRDLEEMGFAQMELVGGRGTEIGSPSSLVLQGQGILLYQLMELSRIEESELQELSDLLNEPSALE